MAAKELKKGGSGSALMRLHNKPPPHPKDPSGGPAREGSSVGSSPSMEAQEAPRPAAPPSPSSPPTAGAGRAGGPLLPAPNLVEQLLLEADRKRFRLREVEDKRASMMGAAPISLSSSLSSPSAPSPSPSSSSSSSSSLSSSSSSSSASLPSDRHAVVASARPTEAAHAAPENSGPRPVAPGPGPGAPALPPKRSAGVSISLPPATSVSALKQQTSPRNVGHHVPSSASPLSRDASSTAPLVEEQEQPREVKNKASGSAIISPRGPVDKSLESSRQNETTPDTSSQPTMRQQVIDELVATESDYVRDLKLVLSVYFTPLKTRGILSNAELQAIFSNISVLLNVNEQLEKALIDMRTTKEDKVGHIFLEMADYFKMYTQYCANQENCIKTMDMLEKKNKAFVKFLDECVENPATRNLSFNAFLIKPIQRICKYPLLLRELLKFTSEEHPDYADAKAALEKVQSVVEVVNKKKRESENLQKILEIQGQISNIAELGQSLVKPGRQFCMAITCGKISSQGKSQERHLFLFSDILLETSTTLFQQKFSDFKSTIKGRNNVPNSRKVYTFKRMISLKRCSIWSIPDSQETQNGFEILQMDGEKKIITLYCKTAEEKSQWIACMTERIQFFQDKARKKQSVQTGSVGNSAVPGPALPVELILTPSSRPKKITGKTRTRLPTQMFEGTELNFAEVVDSDPVSPRAPSSGKESSSPRSDSSTPASPGGSQIGGQSEFANDGHTISGYSAYANNHDLPKMPQEAQGVELQTSLTSVPSRRKKDRRAPVLLEKLSLDVELERIEKFDDTNEDSDNSSMSRSESAVSVQSLEPITPVTELVSLAPYEPLISDPDLPNHSLTSGSHSPTTESSPPPLCLPPLSASSLSSSASSSIVQSSTSSLTPDSSRLDSSSSISSSSNSAERGRVMSSVPPSVPKPRSGTRTASLPQAKPQLMPTTNPLPLAVLGITESSPLAASSLQPSPPSLDPGGPSMINEGTNFRSRVSYYTPNPTLVDDPSMSTTTTRAVRPRVPRGRGRG